MKEIFKEMFEDEAANARLAVGTVLIALVVLAFWCFPIWEFIRGAGTVWKIAFFVLLLLAFVSLEMWLSRHLHRLILMRPRKPHRS